MDGNERTPLISSTNHINQTVVETAAGARSTPSSQAPRLRRRGGGLTRAQVTELLRRAREHGDPEAREALLAAYAPLVRSIAEQFQGRGEAIEDLCQEGTIGLLSAIDRFEPDRNAEFPTFAYVTIRGRIHHHLRDHGALIPPPAWVQESASRIERTRARLAARLGREPSDAELSEAARITEERLREIMAARRQAYPVPFGVRGGDEGSDLPDDEWGQPAAPEPALSVDDRLTLEKALCDLEPLERQVIESYYIYELTQTRIASNLGLPGTAVARILRTSTLKLREGWSDGRPAASKSRSRVRLWPPERGGVIDEPTGLYTPGHFRERLEEELLRARRGGHPLAVMRLRVEGIPDVGRPSILCDALQTTARILRSNLRRTDIVARLEPREFGIIMPYTSGHAVVAGARLEAALSGNEEGLPLRAHFGVAIYPDQSVTVDGLMDGAEPMVEW